MDIREIDGLWCYDITFCQETCERMDCPRNKHHIRDRSVPHSFSVEIPQDCPKKQEGRWDAENAIDFLKEQEAVVPTWSRGKPFCGACGLRIHGGKFCSECGKQIAWEGR